MVDSAIIVFREGLEAILIFAAVIASFSAANRAQRPPVAGGAGIGLAAAVATWFLAQALLGLFSDTATSWRRSPASSPWSCC